MADGNKTSEFSLAKYTGIINMLIVVLGGVMTALQPDTIVYAILAAVLAAANAWVSSSYTKGRSIVKANETDAGGSAANPT